MQAAKKYTLECHGGDDYLCAPEQAVFEIDEATAREILKLAAIVREHKLHKVEKFDYRVEWMQSQVAAGLAEELEDDSPDDENVLVPARTEADCLNVDDDSFWFTCYRKYLDDEISTKHVEISEIASHFGLVATASGRVNAA